MVSGEAVLTVLFFYQSASLNPSFGGIWCRVTITTTVCGVKGLVLILLLVEYGIGFLSSKSINSSGVLVLILLLVEYGVGCT